MMPRPRCEEKINENMGFEMSVKRLQRLMCDKNRFYQYYYPYGKKKWHRKNGIVFLAFTETMDLKRRPGMVRNHKENFTKSFEKVAVLSNQRNSAKRSALRKFDVDIAHPLLRNPSYYKLYVKQCRARQQKLQSDSKYRHGRALQMSIHIKISS